jgi:hypothetical protein
MRRPFPALTLLLAFEGMNQRRRRPDSISDQSVRCIFPTGQAAAQRQSLPRRPELSNPPVTKPLCITGYDLSESCTTYVRQFYQDVTAWASA